MTALWFITTQLPSFLGKHYPLPLKLPTALLFEATHKSWWKSRKNSSPPEAEFKLQNFYFIELENWLSVFSVGIWKNRNHNVTASIPAGCVWHVPYQHSGERPRLGGGWWLQSPGLALLQLRQQLRQPRQRPGRDTRPQEELQQPSNHFLRGFDWADCTAVCLGATAGSAAGRAAEQLQEDGHQGEGGAGLREQVDISFGSF